MPLPANGVLSLQGHVGPGVTEQSKPKQAMVVRMSAETFEALEAQPALPKVEVEFGDNPGIYVGDTFFPMRPHQEHSPHELYIRAVPANKTTAPLKFYANVTGKFMVERQLGARVENVVRDKTVAAEKQRTERKTIMLDAPPPTAPPVKAAKKKAVAAKKYTAIEANRTLSASSSAQSSRMISPRPPTVHVKEAGPSRVSPRPAATTTKKDGERGRLIHFLALNPRTVSEVMKYVGGVEEGQPPRQDLIELLKAVAQPVMKQNANGTSPRKWLLKPRTWLEVKPYTFPNLSLPERHKLAKKAQASFENIGLPESDPRWDDIRPRTTDSASTSREAPGAANGATGAGDSNRPEGKNKQIIGKARATAANVPAKDESTRVIKSEGSKFRGDDDSMSASGSKASARRLPGSGFKIKAGSDTPPASDLPSGSADAGRKAALPEGRSARPEKQAVTTVTKSSHQASSLPPPPPRERRPSIASNASTTRVPQSSRDSNEFARPADPAKGRARESPVPSFGQKRKKPLRDEQDAEFSERESTGGSKRRKTEEDAAAEKRRERNLALPKKPPAREPSPPPPPRPRQHKIDERSPMPSHSPLPPPSPRVPAKQPHHERAPSFSSNRSRDDIPQRSGSAKSRRKSPVFTSSDEEKEPRRRTEIAQRTADKPVVEDSAMLGTQYKRKWRKYYMLHQEHDALVNEIRELLQGGSDEIYLSPGDPGLPGADELRELKEKLDREEKTLRAIMEKRESLRKLERASGGSLDTPDDA
ncbi:hypothetical protein BDW22DRAFT_546547 [Trametopsis cervina]|nr:hypothetical protein BDW22DRAFT_546547 [Trametopsis cervina]